MLEQSVLPRQISQNVDRSSREGHIGMSTTA